MSKNLMLLKIAVNTILMNKLFSFFLGVTIIISSLMFAMFVSSIVSLHMSETVNRRHYDAVVADAWVDILPKSVRGYDTPIEFDINNKLENLNYISYFAIHYEIAFIRTVNATFSMMYVGEENWRRMFAPIYQDINGTYPVNENEIMLPMYFLHLLNITQPTLGMEIPIVFECAVSDERMEKTFYLSGYYTGFAHYFTFRTNTLYVSRDFAENFGYTHLNELASRISIVFEDESGANLISELQTTLQWPFRVRSTRQADMDILSFDMVFRFSQLLVMFVPMIISGFMLIYNLSYMNVPVKVRLYGNLKSNGAKNADIRKIIYYNTIIISLVFIPFGLILNALFGHIIINILPNFLLWDVTVESIIMTSSPLIALLTTALTLATVVVCSSSAVAIASKIQPIESIKYTGKIKSKNQLSSIVSGKLRTSIRNITREGKRLRIVSLSMLISISVFLTMSIFDSAISFDVFIDEHNLVYDFTIISNFEFYMDIDDDFISQITNIETVESIRMTYKNFVFTDCGGTAVLYGISSNVLPYSPGLSISPEDLALFEHGEIAFVKQEPEFSLPNTLPYTLGTHLALRDERTAELIYISLFDYASFPLPYLLYSPLFITPPVINLYVSDTFFHTLFDNPYISRIDVISVPGFQNETEAELNNIIPHALFNMVAKESILDLYLSAQETQNAVYGSIFVFLLIITVLNFLVFMVANVLSRKNEFTIMEGIGLNREYILKLLSYEGLVYFVISFILSVTIGNAIAFTMTYYGVTSQFEGMTIQYPFTQVITMYLSILAVCLITPIIAYKLTIRNSIIDRLREWN